MKQYPEAYMQLEKNAAGDDVDLFIYFDGKKIAKRGHPGTPLAKTWISLDPEFRVRDGKQKRNGGGQLIIEHCEVELQ